MDQSEIFLKNTIFLNKYPKIVILADFLAKKGDFCENILYNFWARVHILKGKLRIFFRPPRVRNILKIKNISEMYRVKMPAKNKYSYKTWCIQS